MDGCVVFSILADAVVVPVIINALKASIWRELSDRATFSPGDVYLNCIECTTKRI